GNAFRPNDRRMYPAGRQVEAVSGAQLQLVATGGQLERHRSGLAIEHLVVVVAVAGIAFARSVRPPVRLEPLTAKALFKEFARWRAVPPARQLWRFNHA